MLCVQLNYALKFLSMSFKISYLPGVYWLSNQMVDLTLVKCPETTTEDKKMFLESALPEGQL